MSREKRSKVLVIDDDKTFCLLMKRVAKNIGIDLDFATTTNELSKIKSIANFDVIWIDYDLVETTGLAIAEELNLVFPQIPVVLISSSNRPFTDEVKKTPNVKGILSKWDLTEQEISDDLIENALGEFHSSSDLHDSQWQNTNEDRVEPLRDHFTQEVPMEKYRA